MRQAGYGTWLHGENRLVFPSCQGKACPERSTQTFAVAIVSSPVYLGLGTGRLSLRTERALHLRLLLHRLLSPLSWRDYKAVEEV